VRKRRARRARAAPGASGALANPRFLEALFSSESTRDKRNTKAIDFGAQQSSPPVA
jgi:hypothetical protein